MPEQKAAPNTKITPELAQLIIRLDKLIRATNKDIEEYHKLKDWLRGKPVWLKKIE